MHRAVLIAAIAIATVWLLCAWDYVRQPATAQSAIAQVAIGEFSPDLIRAHRIPYTLHELLPSPAPLLDSVFKYSYVYARSGDVTRATTTASYTLLFALEDAEVEIAPVWESDALTRLRLRAGRVVVMPPRWRVDVVTGRVASLELYDPSSACATLLGHLRL
jgi:hypothetical protein